MIKLTLTNLIQRHCKLTKKWAVVLNLDVNFSLNELQMATPFLEFESDDDIQAIADGLMIVLCDSEGECEQVFGKIQGDGPCKVYTWTCGPDGRILNENT